MSTTHNNLDAQLAECRAILTRPGFRCRTDAEHAALNRRDMAAAFGCVPMPDPPCDEGSPLALNSLIQELRQLESEAAELRK